MHEKLESSSTIFKIFFRCGVQYLGKIEGSDKIFIMKIFFLAPTGALEMLISVRPSVRSKVV